jgi:hypothetical protein
MAGILTLAIMAYGAIHDEPVTPLSHGATATIKSSSDQIQHFKFRLGSSGA